ncbi:putative reverse transcriptase domain-containing protein [Tanacetum coccineum]
MDIEDHPIVICAEIGGHNIHRMYVDGGSTLDILYEHCFLKTRLEIRRNLIPTAMPLVGFSGEITWPLGQILLRAENTCPRSGRIRAFEEETRDLDVEIKQMQELKASYGVTTPQELRRNQVNERMSHHPSYGVNASSCLRLDAETRRKVHFKGPIPKMTPTKGTKSIKELSAHSFSWYKEGNIKSKNEELQVVPKQVYNFENNMNIITEEVRMAQHKYETLVEGRISNLEETLNNFIKESLIRHKERKIAKRIQDREAGSLPSSTEINPRGIAENVIVKINEFIFPIDIVVLDMKEDKKILIILGRPFLATAHAMIDVFNKKISFEVGNETITFDIEKSMKFSTPEDDICLSIDMVDEAVLDHVQEILYSNPLDSFLFKPVINYQQRNTTNLWVDEDDDLDDSNESGSSSDHDDWKPNDFIRPTLFATSISEAEAQLPKLKELLSHLEYSFLNNNQEFLVIISSLLTPQEKESLLKVLTKHKAALAWKVSDIKGISPSFYTHKILMEDDFKPVVQPQRRLNPKVQDVVKAKIVKLLDARLIYAIFDSP